MAERIIIIILLILLYSGSLCAQPAFDTSNLENMIEGAENATASVINDSFAPMTHYHENNWTVRIAPGAYRLLRAYDDPEIEAEDFYGWGIGAGAGYAFSDQLMAYGIAGRTDAQGDLKGDFYGDDFGKQAVNLKFNTTYVTTGLGYDVVKGKRNWSIPLYAGLFIQHYDADADLSEATDPVSGVTYDGTVAGSDYLYGFSGGIALSYRLYDNMKITPYYLYSTSFNESEFDAEIENSLTPIITEEKIEPGRVTTSMLGLNISYETTRHLAFSVSIGGLLTSQFDAYSENYQDGLQINTVIFIISYKGGGY